MQKQTAKLTVCCDMVINSIKYRFHKFTATLGEQNNSVDMIAVAVILRFLRIVFVIKSVNDDDFNFHFFGNDAFYVNACLLTCFYAVLTFCKSCKVRGVLEMHRSFLHCVQFPQRFRLHKSCLRFLPKCREVPYGLGLFCRFRWILLQL